MVQYASVLATENNYEDLMRACVSGLGDVASHTIGFVYVTTALTYRFEEIVNELRQHTGIESWFGTCGEGVCGREGEVFGSSAISVLTCNMPEHELEIVGNQRRYKPGSPGQESPFIPVIGVVHGNPREPETLEAIRSLASDHNTFLVGGLTAGSEQFPQVAIDVQEQGVSGLMLGAECEPIAGVTQGCSPIGPFHEVTGGHDHYLHSLDEIPAFKILCEDLGVNEGVDPLPWLNNVHAAKEVTGSDKSEYVVRNLVAIDPTNGTVAVSDQIQKGDRWAFVRRDREAAEKDFKRMLEELKSRCNGSVKAGLYYSCIARGPSLFPDTSYEVNNIKQVFGEFPLAGFFGNGEIFNNRVYGYTGVLVLFMS